MSRPKATRPKSAHTTVTVPQALRERMMGVEEYVNWSAIASAAFERKLIDIEGMKKERNLLGVLKRLQRAAEELEEAKDDLAMLLRK